MKSRYRIAVLVITAVAGLLSPVIVRAAHPHIFQAPFYLAQTAQPGTKDYQFTTFDAPGTSDTEAYGINNPGVVPGFYVVQGRAHGFVWRNGSLMTVDHPDARNTLLGDVNEPGLVVGNYGPFDLQHAATYDIRTGTWTTLPDVPNLPMNIGNGINPQGIAVGSAAMGNLNVTFNSVAWIWDGREYSFFNVPGAAGFGTTAGGINAPGQVAGYFQDANGSFHGFLKDGSTFTQIDVPGAKDTFGYAINSRTDLAGWYVDQQGVEHGFVLSGGNFTTIDVPGSLGTLVTGINQKGELAGLWFAANATHAFTAIRH
jgi:probable HAF family extracellular repeat protein